MTNTFVEYLSFVFWLVVFYHIIAFVAQVYLQSQRERTVERIDEAIAGMKEVLENHIPAKVEQHGDQFYLFNRDTDQFIAQGRDAQEIADRTPARQSIYVTDGEPDVVQRFKATIPADA